MPEFVTLMEKNTKENETYFFFCQWTGNETALTFLKDVLDRVDYDELMGEYITLSMDTTLLSESTVDQMTKILKKENNYHTLFTKCTGTLHIGFTEKDVEAMDEYKLADFINDTFYTCRIPKLFSEYRNLYQVSLEEYKRLL